MAAGIKRKIAAEQPTSVTTTITTTTKKPSKVSSLSSPSSSSSPTATTAKGTTTDMGPQLRRIDASNRTPFEKRVWRLLCQIPAGRFSTYGLLSAHLGSSPRAVGNAMRRNPFAPGVPCHRCVATGGKLGGFKGQWPRDGEGITLDEKRMLLRKEGVRFDGSGRVVGTPFSAFV
ncbi:uncharacterized protein E0L32_008841 [Thyridium curvatum]|uniref:Methylated-DNA--protein-cysteine methyltransferase n=1 Tax=Thyridium curvatum TaxID=1093900 RepID=A0A507AU27_9PEZI|nr:uncharacterized protein E0L32_008841 [Thyridium curvatum]TPX09994.1 hypothetical protein E0L32_008841 [Thyridium curvatum]